MDPTAIYDKISALSSQILAYVEQYSKLDVPASHKIATLIFKFQQCSDLLENMEHKEDIAIGDDDGDADDYEDGNGDDIGNADEDDCDPEIVGICDMLMDIKYGKQDELSTFDAEYDKVWGRIDAARDASKRV